MIDLRNIARHLHLPVEQIKVAADLLQQGYQPAFISRYRADEIGAFPVNAIWPLKLAIERQQRLDGYRHKAVAQLGEVAELDDVCQNQLEQAHTEVEIESILRAFRVRKHARTNPDKGQEAAQLLEKIIAYAGPPIEDLQAWAAAEMSVDAQQAEQFLQNCTRLIGNLIASDAKLADRLRRSIQSKASVQIELLTDIHAEEIAHAAPAKGTQSKKSDRQDVNKDDLAPVTDSAALEQSSSSAVVQHDHSLADPSVHASLDASELASATHEDSQTSEITHDFDADTFAEEDHGEEDHEHGQTEHDVVDSQTESGHTDTAASVPEKGEAGKKKRVTPLISKKPFEKMTPRQRRRRWLVSVLQPFRGLNKPLSRLTSYQLLMIGRGQRSQLAKVKLNYSVDALVNMARDVFVAHKHPLVSWFTHATDEGLKKLLPKIEHDALAELEEQAQQRLLERAVDQLRSSLMQRPVRGHCILAIDTVGPKQAAVAIVDYRGHVLHADEIICSSHASNVSQNVIQLGELIHRFKVTMIALSNGPARRFLIHTVAELMKQSASGNLRWSMVDRGGADAYASSRIGNEELPQHNRRVRAAAWIARRLQDPLREMLKVEPNRLRLGSFQRELPQDILQRMVHETLMDCVAGKGLDARRAMAYELANVPGITSAQSIQIAKLAAQGKIASRAELLKAMESWSEMSSRQAIGLLRVYGSDDTLDGTLIHPDDYRLAQKLIQATDLTAPAAHPDGWTAPEIRQIPAPSTVPAANLNEPATEASTSPEALPENNEPVASDQVSAADAEIPDTSVVASQAEGDSSPADSSPSAAVGEDISAASPTAEAAVVEPVQAEPTSQAPEYPENAVVSAEAKPPIDVEKIARGWQVGRAKLQWIANCLKHPFADSREHRDWVPMQAEMPTLENLKPGMTVWAVVVGVADFGAFVELGPDCSGLIHVSRLSSQFIEDPHQCVQVGDLVQTWVVSIDTQKKRVGLTALSPREQAELSRQEEERRQQQHQQREHRQRESSPGQRRPDNQRSDRGQAELAPDRKSRVGGNTRGPQGGGRGGPRRGRQGDRGAAVSSPNDAGNKPVVVKSKQPKKPITDAMQKGQEPLRSFSDLLQFYELQKTEPPKPTPPPPTPVENEAPPTSSPPVEP